MLPYASICLALAIVSLVVYINSVALFFVKASVEQSAEIPIIVTICPGIFFGLFYYLNYLI